MSFANVREEFTRSWYGCFENITRCRVVGVAAGGSFDGKDACTSGISPFVQLNQECAGLPGAGHTLWAEVGAGSAFATFKEVKGFSKHGLLVSDFRVVQALANGLWCTRFPKSGSTSFQEPENSFLNVGNPVIFKMIIFLVEQALAH